MAGVSRNLPGILTSLQQSLAAAEAELARLKADLDYADDEFTIGVWQNRVDDLKLNIADVEGKIGT